MNGTDVLTMPKFLEGEPVPVGYYKTPDPYVNAPSCHIDLSAMARYARKVGKRIADLTKDEVGQFAL